MNNQQQPQQNPPRNFDGHFNDMHKLLLNFAIVHRLTEQEMAKILIKMVAEFI